MALYTFFVGSTDWYDAHSSTQHADAFPSLEFWRNNAVCQNVYGVWEGETENVLQVTVPLADDAAAHMIAYAIARRTGNDAVLVSRLAIKGEESLVFGSTRAYRVSTETRETGNRTVLTSPYAHVRVGSEVETRYGRGIVTRRGTIAGWADVNGFERRWDESDNLMPASGGYAYVRDSRGSHVAYLVWSDARVTGVE